jgi:hypothetical protein
LSFGLSRVRRQRFALLVSLVLMVLGLGVAWWAPWRGRPALRYQFVPGQRLVFDLEYLSVSAIDLARVQNSKASSPAVSHSVHTSAQGELVVQVLAVERNRVRLAYHLRQSSIQVAIDGQLNVALAEALEADLQQAAFAEVDPDGRILSVCLSRGRSAASSPFRRAVVAATQVVLPGVAGAGSPSWEIDEDDVNGTAVVRYETKPGSEPRDERVRSLRKARLHYRPAWRTDEEENAATEYLPEGELEAVVDVCDQHLVAVYGTEVTTTRAKGQVVSRTENTVRLQFVRAETATSQEQERLEVDERRIARVSGWQPLSAGTSPEEAETSIQQAELGEVTEATLLGELARAEAGARKALGETPLYLKFKALVYLQPGVSGRLGQRLKAAPAGQGLVLRVLGPALAQSGRAEAQAALVAVVRSRRNDWPAMAELIPTLARARAATPLVEEALFGLTRAENEDVRTTAQLALGTLAQRLARVAPGRAEALVDWAVRELQAARSPTEQRQMLLVLGNTGSQATLAAVRPFLGAVEPGVRGGAVLALRGLKGTEVEEALCKALTTDRDVGVRLEAVQALGERRMTAAALQALATALRKDGSAGVRLAVVRNLGRWHEALPTVEESIRAAAAKDPDREVREVAAALLEDEQVDAE